ncbi:MAG: hypothetical protein OSJ70_05120 [Bacilli bacterium]|nr:hypothetical protein [Bacilli bacterium]
MLEIIIFCVITILASLGVSFYRELLLFKDLADAGYIVDIKKMGEIAEEVEENSKMKSSKMVLKPFFGLLFSAWNLSQYYQYRSQVLNQLNMYETIRKMPENLHREYLKNPTMLNAFMTVLKDYSNIQYMKLPDPETGEINQFRYQFNEDFSEIEIIEVKGPAARVSYREQQEMVRNAWLEIGKQVSYEYETLDNFGKSCKDDKIIELDDSPVNEISAEEVQISSIRLRKIDEENSYFEVEFRDSEGKQAGIFGSPYITDAINFRKEVFGILLACGKTNFLKIGGVDNPAIPITFKVNSRDVVNEICNANNQIFHLNDAGEYKTEPSTIDEREIFEGKVTGITSASNTLNISIENENFHTGFVAGNLYYGFGYPLISASNNPELVKRACNHYRQYIENILVFLGTDDLLNMGGEPVKLPKVLIERDSVGNVIAIGSAHQECHLRITDDNYKIEKGRLTIEKNKCKKLI